MRGRELRHPGKPYTDDCADEGRSHRCLSDNRRDSAQRLGR